MGRGPVYTRKPLVDDPCAHGTEETAAGSIYRRAPLWRCIGVSKTFNPVAVGRRRLPRQSVLCSPFVFLSYYYGYIILSYNSYTLCIRNHRVLNIQLFLSHYYTCIVRRYLESEKIVDTRRRPSFRWCSIAFIVFNVSERARV